MVTIDIGHSDKFCPSLYMYMYIAPYCKLFFSEKEIVIRMLLGFHYLLYLRTHL